MEADWEVEIGPDAPVIDAEWSGFVDLRLHPELARTLPEAASFPALADALVNLNTTTSPVWTAKCDLWPLPDATELDPFELACDPQTALCGLACYIDLLPRVGQFWPGQLCAENANDTSLAVQWCKEICARLEETPLSCCRADLIVRLAVITPEESAVGITAYLTACGATASSATQVLHLALNAFAHAVSPNSTVE